MDPSGSALPDMANPSTKRKRSLSPAHPPTQNKSAKINSSHLQINYLTRQFTDTLPLIASEDPLPSLLNIIGDYDGVLQRHESMAGNLGARPLGPILIKRFERLFDGPPKVLKSHGKEGTTVGWLDVVDFARNKPEQFNLEKTRDGVPVCQFYTKQSRVEISEEDYELIASGMPQKLIPPQPILEDEEKELGTLEILEKNLGHVVHLADQGMKTCLVDLSSFHLTIPQCQPGPANSTTVSKTARTPSSHGAKPKHAPPALASPRFPPMATAPPCLPHQALSPSTHVRQKRMAFPPTPPQLLPVQSCSPNSSLLANALARCPQRSGARRTPALVLARAHMKPHARERNPAQSMKPPTTPPSTTFPLFPFQIPLPRYFPIRNLRPRTASMTPGHTKPRWCRGWSSCSVVIGFNRLVIDADDYTWTA